jgi:gluconokinase
VVADVDDPHGPPTRVVLGLDVGTSGVKAVAFGLDRPWRHTVLREYPLLEPAPGQQVQDPERLLAATTSALRATVASCPTAEVVGLAVGTAMHALLGFDPALRPTTPVVTWADARATDAAGALRADPAAVDLAKHTGTPLHPMSPLAKLRWFARHDPEVATRTRWWLGLKELVLWHLTGVLTTELSSASGTGLFDLRRRTWSPPALALAGIDPAQLPGVLPTTATLPLAPAAAAATGLPPGTPVVTGAGDGPLASLGTRAVKPGVVGLSLGTSGAVRQVVDRPPPDRHPSLFCYALTGSAWTVGSAISTGGLVVRWARAALAPDLPSVAADGAGDRAVLALAAEAPPGSDGLVMLPHLLAERGPGWDPALRGAYLGLRRRHTRAHLARAAVEGVALQLAAIVEQLDRLHPVNAVRATGGTLRAPLWREVLAGALGRPLTVVDAGAGAALGAAALGLVALGLAPSPEAAVEQLAPTTGSDDLEVAPDPALVAVYEATRRSLPRLVADLARAVEPEPPATPGDARPAASDGDAGRG